MLDQTCFKMATAGTRAQAREDLSGRMVADLYNAISIAGSGGLGTVYNARVQIVPADALPPLKANWRTACYAPVDYT